MKCPKCGAEMNRIGLGELVMEEIFEQYECPACGFHLEKKREKSGPKLP